MESSRLRLADPHGFKQKALHWASHFPTFAFFDSNDFSEDDYGEYDMLLAVDAVRFLDCDAGKALDSLKDFHRENPSWLFGVLAYDLKNEVEELQSLHPNDLQLPDLYFFEPRYLFKLKGDELEVNRRYVEAMAILDAMEGLRWPEIHPTKIQLEAGIDRSQYISSLSEIKDHIRKGNFYEINFCQQFKASGRIDPVDIFLRLNRLGEAPFSGLFKAKGSYLICASPERYLKKKGRKLISQPIKGTARRDTNPEIDQKIQSELLASEKERAENVMIVDLVRNDLRRVANTGTVDVPELFGTYAFKQVHQLVSTVTAEMRDDKDWIDALRASFPMGSMTGAPKVEVMKRTEELESFRRAWYSGALGYVNPEQDFDFNVVIRSILYNEDLELITVPVGGAITYDSDPEKEYEECMLKAEAMRKVLAGEA
jgi:para-aminobenzoate synthetase component 1